MALRNVALPLLRMRAAGQDSANEKRLSTVASAADVHAAVHLDIAKPGSLAAETEVRCAARRCAALASMLTLRAPADGQVAQAA